MKRRLLLTFIILTLLGLGPPLIAQQLQTGSIASSGTGTDCATAAACTILPLNYTAGSATISLTGTFSATVQFEATADAVPLNPTNAQLNALNWVAINATPVSSTTPATSAAATGIWTLNAANVTALRVRCSTYASGTVVTAIRASPAASAKLGSSGGGSAFVSGAAGTGFQDVTEIAAPANPAAGVERLYSNSTTHTFACLTSAGTSCNPTAAPGGSNTQLLYNAAGSQGGISGWTTNGTTTIAGGASSIFDTSAMTIANLKLPAALAGTGLGYSSGVLSLNAALPSNETATTQTVGDNTLSVATDAFVLANAGGSAPSGTQGNPLINTNGSTGYATSSAWIDASKFSSTAAIPAGQGCGTGSTVPESADAAGKIQAAICAMPNNGVIDARGIQGGTFGSNWSDNPNTSSHTTKQGVLLLGAGTYTANVPQGQPTKWKVIGLGRGNTTILAGAAMQFLWCPGIDSSGSCNNADTVLAFGDQLWDVTLDGAGLVTQAVYKNFKAQEGSGLRGSWTITDCVLYCAWFVGANAQNSGIEGSGEIDAGGPNGTVNTVNLQVGDPGGVDSVEGFYINGHVTTNGGNGSTHTQNVAVDLNGLNINVANILCGNAAVCVEVGDINKNTSVSINSVVGPSSAVNVNLVEVNTNTLSAVLLNLVKGTGAAGNLIHDLVNSKTVTSATQGSYFVDQSTFGGGLNTPGGNFVVAANGNTTAPVVNATTGFQVGGVAPSGHVLIGNGTNYVDGTVTGGTVNTSSQFNDPEYSAAGIATTISGVAWLTGLDGVPQYMTETTVAGAQVAKVPLPAGVPTNAQTGTTYTVLLTDRAKYLTFSNAASIAVTLPQAGATGFGNNFVFVTCDIGAGTATITPTTSTISYTTGSAYTSGASTLVLTTGQCAWIYSDNVNYFAIVRTGGAGTVTSVATSAPLGGGTITTSGTLTCATCVTSAASLTSNAVVTGAGSQGSQTVADFTIGGTAHTFLAGASGLVDLSAETGASSLKLPAVVGGTILAGTSTANLSAPAVFQNTNSSNNNTSLAAAFTTPGTSTGQVTVNINGATTQASLLQFTTGATYTAGVQSGGTDVADVLPTGAIQTKGTTAGFVALSQGSTSASVAPCNAANTHCIQAPAAVTASVETDAPAQAQGIPTRTGVAATIQDGYSGDAGHSATVTIGSGTSIGSTSLCSTALCLVGTYRVNVYVDITTACGTTGSYTVNLIYTDDQGAKTIPVNINGTGAVPATGVLTTTSTSNYGENAQIIRSTGAASINYSTTAVACGTAGPMVGKLYLSVEPVQ